MAEVTLIGITQPRIKGVKTVGELIAYCARVSNPDNQMNMMTAPKLIKYCVDNNHWSILETASVTMQIDSTRDICRQVLRHRSFTFQEFSQRYADPTKDLGFTIREARLQDTKNRQNSIDIGLDGWMDDHGKDKVGTWEVMQELALNASKDAYRWAIENGIAKEQARVVLPEGLTESRMYMQGTVRSWVHYIQLRSENGTQKEHREIARMCGEVLRKEIPELSELI